MYSLNLIIQLIGPQDDIPFYPISEQLDYEAEFAFVIGKQGKNISEEEALDYVAGYAVCKRRNVP